MLTNYYKIHSFAKKNPKLLLGSFFAIGTLTYIKVWLPLTNLGIPCIFHEVTGLYCPGCGMTRALTALLTLNLNQSIQYNILLYVLTPIFGLYWLVKRFDQQTFASVLMIVMVTLTILFGILKNFPYFSWLAPN